MSLVITRILDSRFEFSLDGGEVISTNAPNLLTKGDVCHFKTKTGANIIKEQNILFSEITIIDTFGGTGSFVPTNIQNLWTKLIELNFFNGVNGSGSGSGVTRFDALLDTEAYFGNNGKIPVVNESQQRLDYTTFYNFDKFTQLSDVSISSLVVGKFLSVELVNGQAKIVQVNEPSGGSVTNSTKVEKIPIIAESGDTSFVLPVGVYSIDLYKEGQWQIQGLDYTYDVNTRTITPEASIVINEDDFFEAVAYYVEVSKIQITATSNNQTEFNFSGIATTVNAVLKGTWLIEGTDYTRTYFSTNNKITIINPYLIDGISIGDLVEIITF